MAELLEFPDTLKESGDDGKVRVSEVDWMIATRDPAT
jgi:hypothetical protein